MWRPLTERNKGASMNDVTLLIRFNTKLKYCLVTKLLTPSHLIYGRPISSQFTLKFWKSVVAGFVPELRVFERVPRAASFPPTTGGDPRTGDPCWWWSNDVRSGNIQCLGWLELPRSNDDLWLNYYRVWCNLELRL